MSWFIATADGRTAGPFDEAGLAAEVAAGRLTPETYVWTEGMAEWAAARDVPAVARIVTPPAAPASMSARAPSRAEPGAAPLPRPAAEAAPAEADAESLSAALLGILAAAALAGFGLVAAYLEFVLPNLG